MNTRTRAESGFVIRENGVAAVVWPIPVPNTASEAQTNAFWENIANFCYHLITLFALQLPRKSNFFFPPMYILPLTSRSLEGKSTSVTASLIPILQQSLVVNGIRESACNLFVSFPDPEIMMYVLRKSLI